MTARASKATLQGMARRRKWLQLWALAGASLLLTCLLIELGLRAYAEWGWVWTSPRDGRYVWEFPELVRLSDHPEIGIEMRPHLDVHFRGKLLRTNSLGYRGLEFRRKEEGVFRIVGIGDSVMMGWGSDQNKTYMARLEQILRGRLKGPRVEVLNFAVSGYNTVQEYYVLRDRALSFDPDLVILSYVGNDFEPPNFRHPRWRFSCPSYALNFLVLQWGLRAGFLRPQEGYDWRYFGGDLGHVPRGFEQAYAAIAALTKARGIPLVTVLDSRYQSEFMSHRQVAALGDRLGASTIDLYRLYRRLPEGITRAREVSIADEHNRLYSIPFDTHANGLWHERTARVIADFLIRGKLIKSMTLVQSTGEAPDSFWYKVKSPRASISR